MISIEKGSRRNTPCYIVRACGMTLYFSYETVIAVESALGSVRRDNDWGPTTGRHMNDMDVRRIKTIVNEEGIETFVERSVDHFIQQRIKEVEQRLTKSAPPT